MRGKFGRKICNPFSNTFIVATHFIAFSNVDVSIIYYLPSIMYAAITAGLSLATYLSLTSKRFKQGIANKRVLQLQ